VMAGSDHVHEMCNMYLMVYSAVSHIEMCSDGNSLVDELAPGNMPHSAQLLRDPFPLWKPPQVDAKLEKVSGHRVECVAGVLLGDFMAVRRQLLLWLLDVSCCYGWVLRQQIVPDACTLLVPAFRCTFCYMSLGWGSMPEYLFSHAPCDSFPCAMLLTAGCCWQHCFSCCGP
jgi:hypothetical protein